MSDQPNIKLPLERLFLQLETAGFKMDTARKLRILKAVNERGHLHLGDFESLKYLLAPLVATSDREQERFYDLFDGFWESCKREAESPLSQKTDKKKKKSIWRFWWILLPVIVLSISVLLYGIIITQFHSSEGERLNVKFDKSKLSNVSENDSLIVNNLSVNIDSSNLYWSLENLSSKSKVVDTSYHFTLSNLKYKDTFKLTLRMDNMVSLESPALSIKYVNYDTFTFIIHCANPPQLQEKTFPQKIEVQKSYPFEIKSDENAGIEWYFPNGDTLRGNKVNHAFEEEGIRTIRGKIYRKGEKEYCYSTFSEEVTVGTNKPFIKYADFIIDKPDANFGLANWIWWLFALPLLGAAWMFRRWWKDRQEDEDTEKTMEELMETYPVNDQAPYYIPYLPQDEKISVPAEFYRMSEILRRREESDRMSFDPKRSVQATIQSGGFPSWRERANTTPTDYLFLVKRASERDQQGRLFERLTSFFKKQDVPVAAYFHDGNFRSFWNDQQPDGVSLDFLNKQYHNHRLVLLGDGHGLLNPYDTREPALLQEPLNKLLRWKRRLLLTPSAVSGWSFQEALLYRHFLIYPTDTEGVLDGLAEMDWTDEYEPGAFTSHERSQNEFRTDHTERYHTWDTIEEHRLFLKNDPECFRWLCGLATTSQPDFALTVAIGRSLGIEITHDRLLRLTRIPWLSSNEPNERLRMLFLSELTENEEIATRKAALEELEKVATTVKGGFAEAEWTATSALHKFALDPRDEAHKETIRDLIQLGLLTGAQTEELNWIVDHKIEDKELPAGTEKTIEGWLTVPAEKPFFNQKMIWTIALVAMSLLLFGLGYSWHQNLKNADYDAAPFWVGSFEKIDPAVEMNNDGVAIAEHLKTDTLFKYSGETVGGLAVTESRQNLKEIKSIAAGKFEEASEFRFPVDYPIADSNYFAAHYNYRAQLFNFFLTDSVSSEKPANILNEIKRETDFFNRKSTTIEYAGKNHDSLKTAMVHLAGLAAFYLEDLAVSKRDSSSNAVFAYNIILKRDSNFFDNIRTEMPVNLQTLLADAGVFDLPRYWLRAVVLNEENKPLNNARISITGLPRLRTGKEGKATYLFDGLPPATDFRGRIALKGYEEAFVNLKARTSELFDTIILKSIPVVDTVVKKNTKIEVEKDTIEEIVEKGYQAKKIALLIGNNKHNGVSDLRNSINDARELSRKLRTVGYKTIILENATRIEIMKELNKISVSTYESFVFYFSGHSLGDEELETTYIIPSDFNNNIEMSAIELNQIFYQFKNLKTKIFMLDAMILHKMKSGFKFNLPINSYMATASGIGEMAYESSDENLDYFTAAIVRNLDTPNIEIHDLFGIVSTESREKSEKKHTRSQSVFTQSTLTAPFYFVRSNDPPPTAKIPPPTMISVPGSTFTMGCTDEQGSDCEDDESPPHQVTLSDFAIGKYEVTNEEFAAFMNEKGNQEEGGTEWVEIGGKGYADEKCRILEETPGKFTVEKGYEKHPMIYVSWYGARAYCNWLSEKTGKNYRLPTEAEWEYAARGGKNGKPTKFAGSDDVNEVAWYTKTTNDSGTKEVGTKNRNELGIYDMSGNVYEWCADWYGDYIDKPQTNPLGSEEGNSRVLRGGSWNLSYNYCRVSFRNYIDPDDRNLVSGFRVAQD